MNVTRYKATFVATVQKNDDTIDKVIHSKYRTRAIITRSRFETALDYKPRIFKFRKVSLYLIQTAVYIAERLMLH